MYLLLISLSAIYISLNVLIKIFGPTLIFPYRGSSYQENDFPLRVEAADSNRIALRYEPITNASHLILYHHGNGEDLGHLSSPLPIFHDLGLSVLTYDYPGYGRSSGKPSEASVLAAAEAAYRWAVTSGGWSPDQLIQYGRSIGGGPALHLATFDEPPAGVILEAPFLSVFRVVTRIPALVRDPFPNQRTIRLLNSPLLIIHGTRDQIVPFDHGTKLFQIANPPKRHLWVENGGHNNLMSQHHAAVKGAIADFLRLINDARTSTIEP